MHGLILAGGVGARLAADGVRGPKALVPVAGRPLLRALAERFAALGCATVTCVVRDEVAASLAAGPTPLVAGTRVVVGRTPSSLHSLALGLARVPPGDVLCGMVDTVMAPEDWRLVHERGARGLAAGAAAVLAVTPDDGGDDAPLWAHVAATGAVTGIGGARPAPPLVTAGAYVFGAAARACVPVALAAGRQRMRAFLADLVESGADVRAAEVAHAVDVDHARDLARATALLVTRRPRAPGAAPAADR